MTTSILVGIKAVSTAASMTNWSLCHVIWTATLLGNDAWQRWQQNRRNRTRLPDFLHNETLHIDQSWRLPLSYSCHEAQLLWHQCTQQSANMLGNRFILLKLGTLPFIMFISYSKAQCINKTSCLFVTACDGCTADAEHRRQQQWHIYIAYVPPHAPCPRFGMSAMFRATAAEV